MNCFLLLLWWWWWWYFKETIVNINTSNSMICTTSVALSEISTLSGNKLLSSVDCVSFNEVIFSASSVTVYGYDHVEHHNKQNWNRFTVNIILICSKWRCTYKMLKTIATRLFKFNGEMICLHYHWRLNVMLTRKMASSFHNPVI